MRAPRRGWFRDRHRALRQHLLSEHTSPMRLAMAVFVGCLVGCSPLFGLHLPICVAAAWLFGLNKLVVYGAANLSIPPFVPFLGFVSVQLGERVLRHRWLSLHLSDFHWDNARELAHRFFVAWLLGGLFLGGAIGAAAGLAVLQMALRRRVVGLVRETSGDPLPAAIELARERYDGLPPRFKWYARMKYVMDPCYRAIAPLVPDGAFTVDLGTGLGMLPVLLGVLGGGRRALGIEWDGAKVACGIYAAKGLEGIEVVEGDARDYPLPSCDVLTLVDMLHYYDTDVQRALLRRCHAALRPGGRLLIREGDAERKGGARWTRIVEQLATRLGWNRGPKVRFRPIAEIMADLESLGFAVRVDEVAGKLHPGNVLLVAERQVQIPQDK